MEFLRLIKRNARSFLHLREAKLISNVKIKVKMLKIILFQIPEFTNYPTWIIDPIDGTMNFVHGNPLTW
jgi:3'-phosphoadenosine 5'-phosphosulfate (PAPS) 3'-phosphatase